MNKKDLKPIITNKSKKEINFQKLNDSKIKKELGWKQKISIIKGLKNTITWYQKNYSLINKKFK
jgi:dTDP-D-glucose 4,6-dehydratase